MKVLDGADVGGWLDLGEDEWHRTVCFGPAGFQSYARLRFIPDPIHPGQAEASVVLPDDHPDETEQFLRALGILQQWTTTPGHSQVAFWDGTPLDDTFRRRVGKPGLVGHARSYHLLGIDARDSRQSSGLLETAGVPAFTWPHDRAWCIASDVDPHWAGIGARRDAIEQLVATPGLDVVPALREEPAPSYQ